MATIDVKDATNNTVAIEKPNANGRVAAASSRPTAACTEDKAVLDAIAASAADVTTPIPVKFDQTTPGTTNGVQINAALPAGTNNIGDVDVLTLPAVGKGVAVSLMRTADTNAYLANDVLGSATGSTAALSFASIGPSGAEIMITSAGLEIDASAVPSGMTSFRLYLYNVTPPSALGDNAAWDLPSGDRASFLGYVDLGTPIDLGSTLYVETNGINKQLTLSGTGLFAYLVTNGAYTPASATVHKITLHATPI